MINIIRAENSGFCFGVKRAVDKAFEEAIANNKNVYCIGELIHNEHVNDELKNKGVLVIDDTNEIKKISNEKVIIRTHGIEKETLSILKSNANDIINLTCPFVSKIHKIVEKYSENGYKVIVLGDKKHPEVKGIVSYSKTDTYVVNSIEDLDSVKIDKNDPVLVVFQTTANKQKLQKVIDILQNMSYNIILENTICDATEKRQVDVYKLSKNVDIMLIIGSKNSSNTNKLFLIAKENCEHSYMITDVQDLQNININKNAKIGVSAGASTPECLIEEIINNVRNEF